MEKINPEDVNAPEEQHGPGGFVPNRAQKTPSPRSREEEAEALRERFGPDKVKDLKAASPPSPRSRKKGEPLARESSGSGRSPQPPPAVQPQREGEKSSPSLKDRLLRRAKTARSAGQLRQTLQEAQEAGRTMEVVQLFADTVRRGDEVGRQRFSFTRTPEQAEADWFALPWEEWEKHLNSWAQGGDIEARAVMEDMELYAENVFLRDLLRAVVEQFERPCRQIAGYGQLVPYLENLVEGGFVQCLTNPRHKPEHGVAIRRGRDEFLYLPLKGVQVSILGWPHIKEAEERAKKRATEQEAKVNVLEAKVTPGLTPQKVSEGEEGHLFLFLGWARGVLIEAKKHNGRMMARVVEAVGVWVPQLPSDWVLWSPDNGYVPLRGAQWPLSEIPEALKAWEERFQRREKEQARIQEILAPVTSLATLPIPWKEKGLTRLLQGETGIAVAWHRSFEWGRERGLFAQAFERREGEEFLRLREFVSVLPFPSHLRGKRLPRLVVEEREDGSLQVGFGRLPRMKEEVFSAIRMVEKALRLRLNVEHRTSSEEPASEKGNNQTG